MPEDVAERFERIQEPDEGRVWTTAMEHGTVTLSL